MIRSAVLIAVFLLLSSFELGGVSAFPVPVDRLPLLLVVSVFCFQFLNIHAAPWWVLAHGLVVDLSHVSFVPFELLSYLVAAIAMILASRHLFTNRSFWGILGTFTLSLLALTSSEILIAIGQSFFGSVTLSMTDILLVRAWGLLTGGLMLLMLFPLSEFFKRLFKRIV
jgi:hypothetical protein